MKGTSRERTSSTAREPQPAGTGIAETGIEEAGVMHAEFADQRIERHHLGGIVRRHLHRLGRCEDVKFVRIEDQAASARAAIGSQKSATS